MNWLRREWKWYLFKRERRSWECYLAQHGSYAKWKRVRDDNKVLGVWKGLPR